MEKLPLSVRISLISLIIINLASILGILFLGWSAGFILLAYWLESFVIGLYTVLKMAKTTKMGEIKTNVAGKNVPPSKFFLIPFYIFHYGIFMFVHLMFLLVIIGMSSSLSDFANMAVWLPVFFVGLLISHGISYKQNFIGNKEYANTTVSKVMMSSYARIVPMHLAIIFGFMLGSPAIVLVLIKTGIDVFSHVLERRKIGTISNA